MPPSPRSFSILYRSLSTVPMSSFDGAGFDGARGGGGGRLGGRGAMAGLSEEEDKKRAV